MKILHLILKKRWYDMIASGEKTEEYREIKPYWSNRLFKGYTHVCFHLGYTAKTMLFPIIGIAEDTGKEEWGAEKGKTYYVIKLGNYVTEYACYRGVRRRAYIAALLPTD